MMIKNLISNTETLIKITNQSSKRIHSSESALWSRVNQIKMKMTRFLKSTTILLKLTRF